MTQEQEIIKTYNTETKDITKIAKKYNTDQSTIRDIITRYRNNKIKNRK